MGTRNSPNAIHKVTQDHPHAYGDKAPCSPSFFRWAGSSPRVWGQVNFCSDTVTQSRIIPTRMGTSCITISLERRRRDHPHAYGDKDKTASNAEQTAGSSPRVWGQAEFPFVITFLCRIIPTRMGTSLRLCVGKNTERIIPTRMGTSAE